MSQPLLCVLSCKLGSAVDRLSHDQDLGKGICQDDVDADFSTLDSVWRAPMLLERPAHVWRAPMLLKRPAEDEAFTALKLPRTAGTRR